MTQKRYHIKGDVEEIIDEQQQEDSATEIEQTDYENATHVTKTDQCLSPQKSYGTNNIDLVTNRYVIW